MSTAAIVLMILGVLTAFVVIAAVWGGMDVYQRWRRRERAPGEDPHLDHTDGAGTVTETIEEEAHRAKEASSKSSN